MPLCSEGECLDQVNSRGMCAKHYMRWRSEQPGEPCSHCGSTSCTAERRSRKVTEALGVESVFLCDRCNVYARVYGRLERQPSRDPEVRFWEKVNKGDAEDCWEWTAGTQSGYGRFNPKRGRGGTPIQAHRFAWQALVGPIPDKLTLDHLCLNTLCVNPAHLEVVTRSENSTRRMKRAWEELKTLRVENVRLRKQVSECRCHPPS